MQLFISKALFRYLGYQIKLEEEENNRSKLIISNLVKDENNKEKVENIEFILPVDISDLEEITGNLNITFSKFRKSLNGYKFDELTSTNSKVIYALLHYGQVVPSDIYIHNSMKSYVEVLEKIQFYDMEPDYGDYLASVYFVKITIPPQGTIPFYLSWKSGLKSLENHLVFVNEKYVGIKVKNCRTYIHLSSLRMKEYSSLSKL